MCLCVWMRKYRRNRARAHITEPPTEKSARESKLYADIIIIEHSPADRVLVLRSSTSTILSEKERPEQRVLSIAGLALLHRNSLPYENRTWLTWKLTALIRSRCGNFVRSFFLPSACMWYFHWQLSNVQTRRRIDPPIGGCSVSVETNVESDVLVNAVWRASFAYGTRFFYLDRLVHIECYEQCFALSLFVSQCNMCELYNKSGPVQNCFRHVWKIVIVTNVTT